MPDKRMMIESILMNVSLVDGVAEGRWRRWRSRNRGNHLCAACGLIVATRYSGHTVVIRRAVCKRPAIGVRGDGDRAVVDDAALRATGGGAIYLVPCHSRECALRPSEHDRVSGLRSGRNREEH